MTRAIDQSKHAARQQSGLERAIDLDGEERRTLTPDMGAESLWNWRRPLMPFSPAHRFWR